MNNQGINPKISIITVTYNAAKTIEQTILSVVNQTYSNIEYIIIDGGSADGTIDIIKKYQGKIAYWVSEPDNGIYDAMNKGIVVATGDYVYFLGADDWLVDTLVIGKVVNYILREHIERIDILAGLVWRVDEKLKIKKLSSVLKEEEIYLGIPHQGMFVKTNLYRKNLFNTSLKLVADYDFVIKVWKEKKARFAFLNIPIANYSLGGSSSMSTEIITLEFIKVMNQYSFSKDLIEKFLLNTGRKKNKYIYTMIGGVKFVFIKFNLWKTIQIFRGWKKI